MDRLRTDFIIVHCAATRADQDIGVAEVDRWHKARGWSGCGYQFVLRRNGNIERGRPLMASGAHAHGYNNVSVGVCLAGGIDENGEPQNNFTDEQFESLDVLLDGLLSHFPGAVVLGHRDLPGVAKDCPSFDVRAWRNGKIAARALESRY